MQQKNPKQRRLSVAESQVYTQRANKERIQHEESMTVECTQPWARSIATFSQAREGVRPRSPAHQRQEQHNPQGNAMLSAMCCCQGPPTQGLRHAPKTSSLYTTTGGTRPKKQPPGRALCFRKHLQFAHKARQDIPVRNHADKILRWHGLANGHEKLQYVVHLGKATLESEKLRVENGLAIHILHQNG